MTKALQNYDFVPQQITVGMTEDRETGFVTCRYEYRTWRNVSIFERLCKFKPHDQRNAETELKKAISASVLQFENVPTEGFSLVSHNEDPYNIYWHDEDCTDVVLHDPRGFNVAIDLDNFFEVLEACGNSLSEGVFTHKLAYAWLKGSSRFQLVDAESQMFSECKAQSDTLRTKIDTHAYLSKRELEVGKVYEGSKDFPGKHMYLGEHDVFSTSYHCEAFGNGRYVPIAAYREDVRGQSDPTGRKLVFLRVDTLPVKGASDNVIPQNRTLFEFKSSASKLLEKECTESFSDREMFYHDSMGNSIPFTLAEVQHYMSESLLFNKIDFSTLCECGKPLAANDFKDIICKSALNDTHDFKDLVGFEERLFPFEMFRIYHLPFKTGAYCSRGYPHEKVKVSLVTGAFRTRATNGLYDAAVTRDIDDGNAYQSRKRTELETLTSMSLDDIHAALSPVVMSARLENGKEVSSLHMAVLQSRMR